MPEDGESVPIYVFFKILATGRGSYKCDYFRNLLIDGRYGYYVTLQSLCGHTDTLVELAKDSTGTWVVLYASSELFVELQDKLIATIIEYEADSESMVWYVV